MALTFVALGWGLRGTCPMIARVVSHGTEQPSQDPGESDGSFGGYACFMT